MTARTEILEVDGHEVTVTNPDKVFFPHLSLTKLDLVRYYLAVADGAIRGIGGRPMALKRYVNGAEGDFFFQKRAPTARPDWIETVELRFPSGRTAHEIVVRDAAQLAWIVNLGCIDLNPHPVRADDLDHPDELRVDLDPVPGVDWSQIVEVAIASREVLGDFGLTAWAKTSGSRGFHVYARIERRWTFDEVRRAAVALAREVERREPHLATSKWWKEERHGVFIDYNQNAKDRTVASAYSVRATPDARVSTPLTWDEVLGCDPGEFTLRTVPARFERIGDPWAGIDAATGSLEPLLELADRQEADGLPDAPWPPHYEKQAGEPPRVQPSKRRAATRSSGAVPPPASGRRAVRPGAAAPRCPWSRSPEPRPSAKRWMGSNGGRRDTPRSCRTSRRLTCWSTRCAAGARRGPGSGSISGTFPRRTGLRRRRSRSTTTHGRGSPAMASTRPGRRTRKGEGPMLAKLEPSIPRGEGWTYEPKWDGFRTIVTIDPQGVRFVSRDDRPMMRFFPEIVDLLADRDTGSLVADGELVLVRPGRLSFEELQLRLHPAESRVRKLAAEIPATLILFDLLEDGSEDLRARPLEERRVRLEALAARVGAKRAPERLTELPLGPDLRLTPWTADIATCERWFADEEGLGQDGIMAKRAEQPYQPGVRGWVKVKHRSTADVVVGGYRLAKDGDGVGSLLLGLYDADGRLHYVGHTSSFRAAERRAIREALAPLEGGVGFGEDARSPGGHSRWSAGKDTAWVSLDPVLVCEVSFDRLQGGRFRHAATFVRWRDDRTPASCTFDQVGAEPPSWG